LWAGFPSNLAGIQLLKEYMASEIGVEDGEMVVMSKGLHIYEYCWTWLKWWSTDNHYSIVKVRF